MIYIVTSQEINEFQNILNTIDFNAYLCTNFGVIF